MNDKHINDGGPAFPGRWYDFQPCTGDQVVREQWDGMTLRDFFAAKTEGLEEEVTLEYAEALAGRKRPDVVHGSPENILEWVRFWADADATLRYIKADAMLKARENRKEMSND